MLTRRLGASGLTVSRLGLGTMAWGTRTSPEDARDLLTAFRSAGGTLVDTAHGYAGGLAEDIVGDLLEGPDRDEVVLVTKSGISRATGSRVVDCSRRALMHQLDTSLRRLRTDHVDVWLAHTWDEHTPIEETVSALVWAVESGRARYVGVSNHVGWQAARTMSLLAAAGVPMVATRWSTAWSPARPSASWWTPRGPGLRPAAVVPAGPRGAGRPLPHHRGRRLTAGVRGVRAVRRAARRRPHARCRRGGAHRGRAVSGWHRPSWPSRGCATGRVSPHRSSAPARPTQLAALLDAEDVELPEQIVHALDEVSVDHT